MKTRRVALLTDRRWPELIPDDRPLLAAFSGEDMRGAPVVWNDPSVDFGFFDAVVVRTPWDYHQKSREWEETLARIEGLGVPIWNPPSVLRWNSRKSYLEELEARGVPSIPTAYLPAGAPPLLRALAEQRGWEEIVVKPAVSGGGRDTYRSKKEDLGLLENELAPKLRQHAFLVQSFVPEIQTEGEISLIFFNGDYSHAVRKLPEPGGFLIHEKHGGRVERCRADADLIRWANGVLYFVQSPLLYARVDLIETQGGPLLVELEVLEPELFFRLGPDSAEKFASAVASRLG